MSFLPENEPPPHEIRIAAIEAILASEPDILLFAKHWWWLTDKPTPTRHHLQSNEAYAKRHWYKLVKAAKSYEQKPVEPM